MHAYAITFKNALEMLNQCLAIRDKVLGKEHPHTANSYNNIGMYGTTLIFS